jgi:hypothetical protein
VLSVDDTDGIRAVSTLKTLLDATGVSMWTLTITTLISEVIKMKWKLESAINKLLRIITSPLFWWVAITTMSPVVALATTI